MGADNKPEGHELSDNELIAEFAGLYRREPNQDYNLPQWYHKDQKDKRKRHFVGYPHQLEYATSWDWLMPVVESIKKIKGSHFILRMSTAEFYMWGNEIVSIGDGDALTSTYKAVVEFIKWYNKNGKHH